jgi:hypothetical protein
MPKKRNIELRIALNRRSTFDFRLSTVLGVAWRPALFAVSFAGSPE